VWLRCTSAKAELRPYQFERHDTRRDDVIIDILYYGICHSDVHHVNDDWGRNSVYSMELGHEIISRVVNIGPNLTHFKPGDHVGAGCMLILVNSVLHACKGLNSIVKRPQHLPMMIKIGMIFLI
jgi:uncharacterized zinc-type alcohol dehydrogenase-like protein